MPTINQLIKRPRVKPKYRSKVPALDRSPQKRGVCTKVYTTTPKNQILLLEKSLELDYQTAMKLRVIFLEKGTICKSTRLF